MFLPREEPFVGTRVNPNLAPPSPISSAMVIFVALQHLYRLQDAESPGQAMFFMLCARMTFMLRRSDMGTVDPAQGPSLRILAGASKAGMPSRIRAHSLDPDGRRCRRLLQKGGKPYATGRHGWGRGRTHCAAEREGVSTLREKMMAIATLAAACSGYRLVCRAALTVTLRASSSTGETAFSSSSPIPCFPCSARLASRSSHQVSLR